MTPKRRIRPPLTEVQFVALFQEVRHDINALQHHDEVYSGVCKQVKLYPRVLHNFPSFLGTFINAVKTDTIIRLGRIYDPEGTGRESCTLARCLHVLRDSPGFFTDATIIARLSEAYRNSNPDCLRYHRLDHVQIEKDLDKIELSRKRLLNLRHKLIAHKDLETILTGRQIDFLESHNEVVALIQLAHEIWNRYSNIWNASIHTDKTIGADDYRWLFSCLRRGMKTKSLTDRYQFERIQKRQVRRRTT